MTAPTAADALRLVRAAEKTSRKRIHHVAVDFNDFGNTPAYTGVWFGRKDESGALTSTRYNDLTRSSFLRATRLLRHLGRMVTP